MQKVILYHKRCIDGFMAAVIAKQKYPKAILIPTSPMENELIATISDIISKYPSNILAISYDVAFTTKAFDLFTNAFTNSLVLDHHTTTLECMNHYNAYKLCVDVRKSGCMLAWEHTHRENAPLIVKYIQDRDLYINKLPFSKDISNWLWENYSTELKDENIDAWGKLLKDSSWFEKACHEGAIITQFSNKCIAQAVNCATTHKIGNHTVAACESHLFRSDIGNILYSQDHIDYAMIWRVDLKCKKVYISLRSKPHINVEIIAKSYGGGGHKNAAGFEMNIFDFFQLF
jgi:uncharacterized protein